MKKVQKDVRELQTLRAQLRQTEAVVNSSGDHHLWSQEAAVRKKIKRLSTLRELPGAQTVYDGYVRLLDVISERLLRQYNRKNKTAYEFDEIVAGKQEDYLASGILSVLITSHIPELVAREFKRHFPKNPKDEYPAARSMVRKFVLHLGETNTGKTYRALQRLKQAENGVYLAPLRILALENFERMNLDGIPCDLLTGEEETVIPGAKHSCRTIEKLDLGQQYDVAVIDEIQMIGNSQRGQAWTKALLGVRAHEIHLCGALNAKELALGVIRECADYFEVIEYQRQTPLAVEPKPFFPKGVAAGDALVVFSKRRVLELSRYFSERGIKSSVLYGDLPPEARRMQYEAFLSGENRLLITTDAVGMGVNLPIRRIVFMDLVKFDGEEVRPLTSQEIKQIAGRAGRKGIYEVGYVAAAGTEQEWIKEQLTVEDPPITQAVLGPSEAITKIKGLPLREKLALWSGQDSHLPHYRKMDVRDYLLILDNLKPFRLPEETEYRLINIPFDVNDPELLAYFLNAVRERFQSKCSMLSKPACDGGMLTDLERYYRKIDLYYSFSKAFRLDFDDLWVKNERKRVSLAIHKLLLRL